MTDEELEKTADLIERADLIVLVYGDKKAGLGPDLQREIVIALRRAKEFRHLRNWVESFI